MDSTNGQGSRLGGARSAARTIFNERETEEAEEAETAYRDGRRKHCISVLDAECCGGVLRHLEQAHGTDSAVVCGAESGSHPAQAASSRLAIAMSSLTSFSV